MEGVLLAGHLRFHRKGRGPALPNFEGSLYFAVQSLKEDNQI